MKVLDRNDTGLISMDARDLEISRDDIEYAEDVPVSRDAAKIYPKEISFNGMVAFPHNQVRNGKPLGTCYADSTTALIEYWVWRKCGRKIRFTDEEIFDCALDSKGIYGYEYRRDHTLAQLFSVGGNPAGVLTSAYKFNRMLGWHYFTDHQPSDNFALFASLADESFRDSTSFKVKQLSEYPFTNEDAAYSNAVKILFDYGPFIYVSYTNTAKTSTHAWFAVGAGEDGLHLVNSYGSIEPVVDRWENVVKYFYNASANCLPMLFI